MIRNAHILHQREQATKNPLSGNGMKFGASTMGVFCLVFALTLGASNEIVLNASAQPAPASPSSTTSKSPTPDRTTASFGDWVLRCDRRTDVTPPQRFCEVGQTIRRPGDAGPQAQVGLGRLQPKDPIRITVLLPINVTFEPPVKAIMEGRNGGTIELAWQRCLPSGCFANAVVSDDMLEKLREQKDAGRLTYHDGGAREVTLPISFRGFGEAWETFLRETSN